MAQETKEAAAKFRIDGAEYEVLDLDDLEFREIELIEDAFDLPVEDVDFNRAKAWRWLIYVSMKRRNPDVSFEDLGELKFSAVQDVEEKPKPRPTKPKPKAAAE